MEKARKGMMAWSRAGHDTGQLYVIVDTEEAYAYLADGKLRTLENPKKKKWKHIQVKYEIPAQLEKPNWDDIKNEDIKRAIKMMKKESI